MSITTLAYVDETGYHYADFPTFLQYYKDAYRDIYGVDVYLEADSQDGQWVTVQAQAAYDCVALGAAVYNSFSPATAQGDALSRNVKINGIRRKSPSQSSVDLLIVGQAGATITDGLAEDLNGVKWTLPTPTVIPPGGSVTVTATAVTEGSVQAPSGTVIKIATPTLGWQTVTNPAAASPGDPVETDAELRIRQAQSVALPSRTVLEGIVGGIANVEGVTRLQVYENDTDAPDANGLPEHSISAVVEGGDVVEISTAIANKKTPGAYTHGDIATVVINIYGLPITIRIFRPIYDTITVDLTVKALTGYLTQTGDAIKQAVVDYINNVAIGGGVSKSVEWADAITAANSVGGGLTYKVTALSLSGPGGPGTPDVPVLFNHTSQSTVADITLTVI